MISWRRGRSMKACNHVGMSRATAPGVRLEYLLIPVIFGLAAGGACGTNIGADQKQRALRIALVGGVIAFAISETLGLIAALWPQAWLALFSPDPRVIETGSAYLRIVGPAYGFFGLGMALYFASQGAARLLWPLLTGFLRVIVAIGGSWLALHLTGSLNWLFAALAFGLIVYGVTLTAAITSGAWFGRQRSVSARG